MEPVLVDALTKLFEALLVAAALLVTRYVIPWLRAKSKEPQYAELRRRAEEIVRYGEQLKKAFNISNEELRDRAILLIQIEARELGLEIDADRLFRLVEAAVNAVNAQRLPAGAVSE
ncbi:MAG: phage holin, LLH family [Chloroflexota bacterium]